MGTVADSPYLDTAYKLVAYAGKGRMKLALDKSTVLARKQVFRVKEAGKAARDVLALHDETLDGEPLLQCVMRGGQRTEAGRPRPLDDLRAHAEAATAHLPDHLLALEETDAPYPVVLSDRLRERRDHVRDLLAPSTQTRFIAGPSGV